MKKILFLLIAIASLSASAQRYVWSDSITCGDINGTDTVLYKKFNSGGSQWGYGFGNVWSIEFDYTNLDTTVTLSLGGSNYGNTFNQFVNDSIPYVADRLKAKTVNGTSKATVGFSASDMPYSRFGVKITKNACTNDTLFLKWKFIMQ